MKNNSILDSLKKIYTKMTGKKVVKRKTETDVLSDIAESYDPSQGGTTYTAGTGISIANDTIAIDEAVVAKKSDIPQISTQKAIAYIHDGYPFTLTFDCDDNTIETYADLLAYLKTKGYIDQSTEEKPYFGPTLSCSCLGGASALGESPVHILYAGTDEDYETGETIEVIKIDNGNTLATDCTIEITFLN